MMFEQKYKRDATNIDQIELFEGVKSVQWQSPSNIALIKYWGKRDVQIPQNPSLSFTLKNSFTETKINFRIEKENGISVTYRFDGKHKKSFEDRILRFLNSILIYVPYLKFLHLDIESSNSFPHSAGIASSASSMSSLALCIVSIEKEIFGTLQDEAEFFDKASFLARLGSGSAARSIYGGFVTWGSSDSIVDSSDEISQKVNREIDPKFEDLHDAILITDSEKKKVGSSEGHQLMESHPYANARYKQAGQNLTNLIIAVQNGDEDTFIKIVESEALSLHALMMSSNPGYSLLNYQTWNVINKIRGFRSRNKIMITFTLDAGPNVHLIYQGKNREQIKPFIEDDLLMHCENTRWIDDKTGNGPNQIISYSE